MAYDKLSLMVRNKTNFGSINSMDLMNAMAIFQTYITEYKKIFVVR